MEEADFIKSAQRRHFDSVSADYAAKIDQQSYDYYFSFTLAAIVGELRGHFGVVDKLSGLDLGCGIGDFTVAVGGLCRAMVGADLSPGMIGAARDAHHGAKGVNFEASPSDALPFADDEFDFTMAAHLFHHLAEPELIHGTLLEMKRVTRPGGMIIILDVNKLNPASLLIQHLMVKRGVDTGLERLVWPGFLKKQFRQMDIELRTHRGVCFVPHVVPRLARYNEMLGRIFPHRLIGKDYIVAGIV